jgi:hypothetical protein
MNIGREERVIIVEPITTPVPQRETQPAPARREPVTVPQREREKVPA